MRIPNAEEFAQQQQDRLDAERYRKLKAWMQENGIDDYSADPLSHKVAEEFDSAVDALPDPNENPNRSR